MEYLIHSQPFFPLPDSLAALLSVSSNYSHDHVQEESRITGFHVDFVVAFIGT